MHIRLLSAVAVLAAMGALAGCGQGQNDRGQSAAQEQTSQAPESSTSPMSQQNPQTGQTTPMGESPQGAPTTNPSGSQSMGTSEFAALDTNGDGMLEKSEWTSAGVQGLGFDQVDQNASGDIDRQEYEEALKMSGSHTGEAPGGMTAPDAPPQQ